MRRKLALRWALFFGGAACLVGWYLRKEAGIDDVMQGNLVVIGGLLLGIWFIASKNGWGTGPTRRRDSGHYDGTSAGDGWGGGCGSGDGGSGGDGGD